MVTTVRVPDEYHEWLKTHKREDESMGETLRRLTRAPPPAEPILTETETEGMREAVENLRETDRERLSRVADRLDGADIE